MTEAEFDATIGPKFAALAQECLAAGIDVVMVAEYAPDERAETRVISEKSSLAMKMLSLLAAAGSNIDRFVISFARMCRHDGIDTSNCIVMRPYTENEESQA
jgi:hypothetical protein